jgi:hypothetical protein
MEEERPFFVYFKLVLPWQEEVCPHLKNLLLGIEFVW